MSIPIRNAIVLSDLHLGAATSVLTLIDYHPDTGEIFERPFSEQLLDRLIDDIRAMAGDNLPIQQCILLGDIFDFSFAPYGLTLRNGRRFFQRLVDAQLFEEFIYIPGNHDHHLWTQITEDYYVLSHLDDPPVTHPSALAADELLEGTLMDRLMPEGQRIRVTYPNYAVSVNGHPVHLHHGHFLQKLYSAASDLLNEAVNTQTLNDLEGFNAPFLEFGWYHLGQAFNIGREKLIDRLYFMLKNNNTRQIDRFIQLFFQKVDRWATVPGGPKKPRRWNPIAILGDAMIRWLGPFMLKRFLYRQARAIAKRRLASSARHRKLGEREHPGEAVSHYIRKYMLPPGTTDCSDCTFIFGHTHEPEVDAIYESLGGQKYHLYNTGGWIADQTEEDGQTIRLPQAAPVYLAPDGGIVSMPFTERHQDALRTQLASDPAFNSLRQGTPSHRL